jgi:hypothetical protein
VSVTAGAAARLTSGNANGGDVVMTTGAGIGTGTQGRYNFASAGSGTAAAPSLILAGDTGTGWYRNASDQWTWSAAGTPLISLISGQIRQGSNQRITWSSSGSTSTADTGLARAGANAVVFNDGSGAGGGTAISRAEMNKRVTAIANATLTTVATITIPNAAHSAQIYVEVCGSLGAGGAIGANEASATNCYTITVCRTAGVNAVAAISAAGGSAAAAVAGAATVTCTASLAAVSGAVGASNTIAIQVTITRSGGSSTNHTCLVYAKVMNSNASGVTIS